MDFKEIYLVACDCDYSGQYHFSAAEYVEGEDRYENSVIERDKKRMLIAYQAAKEYADKNSIKIYNATRGGKLEVFERVDLDKVLQNK